MFVDVDLQHSSHQRIFERKLTVKKYFPLNTEHEHDFVFMETYVDL